MSDRKTRGTGTRAARSAVTTSDVAERAGVAVSTVSRVLSGSVEPRPHTAAAVARAVAELGFRVDVVARSLRARSTRMIGVLVEDLEDPVIPGVVQAMDAAANAAGYSVLLGTATLGQDVPMTDVDSMLDNRVDGLVIAFSHPRNATLRRLLMAPVPTVLINSDRPDVDLVQYGTDNETGERMVVHHLVRLGHRRIAYVHGPAGSPHDDARAAGFREACREAGIDADASPEVRGDGRFDGGFRAARRLLDIASDVTAVACYNDLTAIGVLRGLRLAGVRVPEDMSVAGFDDIEATLWTDPPLTTVNQQFAELGRRAIERVIDEIEGRVASDAGGRYTTLGVELRVRESTSIPRAGALIVPLRSHPAR